MNREPMMQTEPTRGFQRRLTTVALALAVCALSPAIAFAQSGIAGTVRDSAGAEIQGVIVEATSPALIEQTRTAVSDGRGEYKIIDLRPGIYTVTFTLEGFNTYKRDGIELPSGFTATVNADLKLGALAETITVTAQAPLVDVQNVVTGQVMGKAMFDAIPTTRMPQAYMTFIPGVNLAASLTGQGLTTTAGGITIHGNRSRDSMVALDGFSQSNWTNPGGAGFYWLSNPATAQEMVAITGGARADQDLSGIQTNVIPKEGGNSLSGSVYGHYSTDRWLGDNRTSTMIAQGVQINGDKRTWDVNPALGGPLIQNKLWFFGSYRTFGDERNAGVLFNLTPQAWVYTPDPSRPPAGFLLSDRDYSLRLTAQAGKGKFSIYGSQQPRTWRSRDIAATNSPEATTWTPYKPNFFVQGTWKLPVSNRFLLEAGMNYNDGVNLQRCNTDPLLFSGPAGSQPAECSTVASAVETAPVGTVARIRSDTAYGLGNGQGNGYRWKVAASYITGSHAFKVGVDMQSGKLHTLQVHSLDYGVNLRNGVPISLVEWAPNDETDHVKADFGLYLQDQWTLSRLTLNLGVRYSWFNGYVDPMNEPGNTIVPAKSYPGVQDVPNWKDIVPRIGAAYDLFGNGQTALKFTVNKYVAGETVAFTRASNPVVTSVLSTTRTWTDSNRNFIPDCNLSVPTANGECGPLANSSFASANPNAVTNDPAILNGWGVRNYNWETSVSLQQQITGNLSLNVGYFRRMYGNIAVNDNTRVTPGNYNQYCVTMPTDARLPTSGQSLCGFFDVNTTAAQVNQTLAQNFPGASFDHFNGVDVTAQFRLSHGVQISGGTSTGREEISACSAVDSPAGVPRANAFTSEFLGWCDTKPPFQTQFKFTAVYPIVWGLQIGANYALVPGPDLSMSSLQLTNAQVAPTLGRNLTAGAAGTVTVPLMPRGALFGDKWSKLDARFTKTFQVGPSRWSGSLDVFNLLNSPGVQLVNNVYNPSLPNGGSWLTPTLLNGPRAFRVSAQFDF